MKGDAVLVNYQNVGINLASLKALEIQISFLGVLMPIDTFLRFNAFRYSHGGVPANT
jgi:hypothetical protein